MSVAEIKSKIAAATEQLDEARALQLLAFAQTLLVPEGTPGHALLPYVGTISEAAAQHMLDTLEEGRQIDASEW